MPNPTPVLTPDPLMNAEELQLWILRQFGAPIVTVELAQCHLEDAIEQGKRWMAAKRGVIRMSQLTLVSGQVSYDLPPDCDLVVECCFIDSPLDLSFSGLTGGGFFLPEQMTQVPYQALAAPMSGGLYSSLTQIMQNLEMDKRILSIERDWSQEGKQLFIYPTPRTSEQMIFRYKSRQFQIEDLPEREHDLLKRYALAKSKIVLGRIRSKVDSYPTAQGQTSLDGQTLLQEGQSELEGLAQEIRDLGTPLFFLSG